MPPEVTATLLDWHVDGQVLGKVRPRLAQLLCDAQPNVFELEDDRRRLVLSETIAPTCEARTEAIASVMETLRETGVVEGWRNELYPIASQFGQDPVVLVERAAVPYLGALEYGVHMNGIISTSPDDSSSSNRSTPGAPTKLWMARRSATKSKYPGMVDHLVAGGQPAGLSLWENAVKECQEEAGLSADLARAGLRPVGAVSYETYSDRTETVARAVLFTYDLYVPADFVPTPVDGEVQAFFPWTVDQMVESLHPDYADPLKPNCYLVMIDWLLRHGHVSPDTPGYLQVLKALRSGDCQ